MLDILFGWILKIFVWLFRLAIKAKTKKHPIYLLDPNNNTNDNVELVEMLSTDWYKVIPLQDYSILKDKGTIGMIILKYSDQTEDYIKNLLVFLYENWVEKTPLIIFYNGRIEFINQYLNKYKYAVMANYYVTLLNYITTLYLFSSRNLFNSKK